ncbi:glycoside hydrolase family 2 TIM barrel-domain containing protein [Actinotignum urinale]|uniref:glycoside hydrolase family 2 protein n=1 Tax=Actinotignum urinale TaxID=190146 RepID=UPI002A80C40F|nr:glycoside hydrolase family 2 TIM barrel-domain containing protein [Actinotignum urinale]MDY5129353.1 glycoside hydrolase family 2 TIM barrel-domain containing protein [Actinotignum urinale]
MVRLPDGNDAGKPLKPLLSTEDRGGRSFLMRWFETLEDGWFFTKDSVDGVPACGGDGFVCVSVPHTWNRFDGQDGGGDYYRGACWYVREFIPQDCPEGYRVFVEFEGAANVAEVFVNGARVGEHVGGYSTFRCDVTDVLAQGKNVLAVRVSNEERSDVYPQMADFTFYGGLYRPVHLVYVHPTHFDVETYGGRGVRVSSTISEAGAGVVDVRAWVRNAEAVDQVVVEIFDDEERLVGGLTRPAGDEVWGVVEIPDVRLWQGVDDPYLYRVLVSLVRHNEVMDTVELYHGVREFEFDPQKGFFLNGELMPLRGVSRHQDRLGVGNALSFDDHVEDFLMIRELGANTVRLAHYQQSQDVYDLCDRLGFIVWAEIPFISKMNPDPAAHQDCINQLHELIYQNYNHSSILMWGISNEILIGGGSEKLSENLRELHALAKRLDPSRVTTMAQVSNTPKDSDHNQITDILSYNHYFGWYTGELEDNETWLDSFHAMHPTRSTGLSEYGCEGIISYHSDEPKPGDYSEEYQAVYHEHMCKIIEERDWLWGTHVWNMFDFGCDARDEGGVKGRNNKGLVTFDRKIKKDAYFICQAYWSDEPMVHICSKRYAKRVADEITVKVYSNQSEVTLVVDNKEFATISETDNANRHVFIFENVPLGQGFTQVSAFAGEVVDSTAWEKVAEPFEPYTYVDPEGGNIVMNWFDDTSQEGLPADAPYNHNYYSVHDTVSEIIKNPDASGILTNAASSMSGMRLKASMLGIMGNKSILEMFDEMKAMFENIDDFDGKVSYLNMELQKVKKD